METNAAASSEQLPLDRNGIEVLSFAQCEDLLSRRQVGRIGMQVAGETVILPVNYRYAHGCVVFRTARGEKADAGAMLKPMAFEIDEWDGEAHTGWSVLVKGTAREVSDDDAAVVAAGELRPWATAVARDIWVRIVPNEITGRRIA